MSGGSVEASGERSVAAGGDIGQVVTGDFVTLAERATVLPAEAFTLGPCTFPVRNVPPRGAQFVGRARELALLDRSFGAPGGVVVHAVHGLGGIGKSTLAAHWATGRAADFNPVWWITAESRTDVEAGLAALGRALQPALVDLLSEDAFRERTLQWLAANDGWLLVLDNVSDPADIQPLLARVPGGRFLITTRRSATSWRGIAEPLDLDVLELAEAVELFTGVHQGPNAGVEELCRELGCLPLAVDQAAAYCREAGITPRKYLKLLAGYPADMYAATAEGGDAQRAVARVWRMTLDRLGDTPEARMILLVTAWWAPDGIPRTYLEPLGSPPQVTEAIRRLAAHSMITLRGDGTISVHRLVQAVARTPELTGAHRSPRLVEAGREIAVRLLEDREAADEEDGEPVGSRRVWATHVEALASRSAPETDTVVTAELYGTAGLQYSLDGHGVRGVALCERAADTALRLCGPDHERTIESRSWLALSYRAAGELDRALTLITQVLADCERALGPDHLQTFEARGATADMLAASGDHERALTLARENAEAAARVLGEDHPETHDARLTLHSIQRDSAKEAEGGTEGGTEEGGGGEQEGDTFVRTLTDQLSRAVATLGEDHSTVSDLRMELLFALRKAGEIDEPLRLVGEAVAVNRRILGDTGMPTLHARALQVVLLRAAGDEARAHALVPDIAADIESALGDGPLAGMLLRSLFPQPAEPPEPPAPSAAPPASPEPPA
ncbi:tetratricopeptide repeat protein [Streptomyces sp. NPDC058470]|uniref:tetratricopeptide repeat protein n=1 Tax=Streptomyces sp. NPDC058470 TaxID=3346515 RepID=UPI00364F451B